MGFDEDLASRVRDLLSSQADVAEKKMFGGLAFLVRDHIAVAAGGQGGLLVRVDPEASQALVASTPAVPMVMRGRAMKGWLCVDAADLRTNRELAKWVRLGTSYVGSLPLKTETIPVTPPEGGKP